MITELRALADELRLEAAELEPERDENTYDPAGECDDYRAEDRREIAARIELILKQAMLDTHDRLEATGRLDRLKLPEAGIQVQTAASNIHLKTWYAEWTTMTPKDACQLRDFLIAALARYEDL